jgi:hypothetical protein
MYRYGKWIELEYPGSFINEINGLKIKKCDDGYFRVYKGTRLKYASLTLDYSENYCKRFSLGWKSKR